MEINKVIKNVFTQEQIAYLNNLVESNYHNIKLNAETDRGRDDIMIDSNISQEIKDVIAQHFDEGYSIYHISYSDYNNNHINPNLPEHRDPNYPANALTFDYQLNANIDWPLCIEKKCYSLENNDAIIFDPKNQDHYRPDLEFKTGDYVRILFFYLNKI